MVRERASSPHESPRMRESEVVITEDQSRVTIYMMLKINGRTLPATVSEEDASRARAAGIDTVRLECVDCGHTGYVSINEATIKAHYCSKCFDSPAQAFDMFGDELILKYF